MFVLGGVGGLVIGLLVGLAVGLIVEFAVGFITGFATGVGVRYAVKNLGGFDGHWDAHLIVIAEWVTSAIVDDPDLDFDAVILPGVAEWGDEVFVDHVPYVFRELEERKR